MKHRIICTLVLLLTACAVAAAQSVDWPVYKGDFGSRNYSALDQINRDNVTDLEVAWTYHTGDEDPYTIECNPIVIDGVMYLTTPLIKMVALEAATGKEIWTFNPFLHEAELGNEHRGRVNRGVAYWTDGNEARLFMTAGSSLFAVDAATGVIIESFGDGGVVNLREGLDRDVGNQGVSTSSPGVVYQDLLVLGSSVGEGPGPGAPGHIRAFDVHTGERRWIFHTIPHPGEFGYETWPEDAWKTAGGANAWGGFSLDEERGWVFAGTGSASNDHFGHDRVGQNLFANTILALDAATGERIWHFQAVHHDLWDYDLPAAPALVTVTHDGEQIDAVAQISKMGLLFVLNRETGEPLFPVEERPVPPSTLPGEQAWPTQPIPTKPPAYAKQGFTEDYITDRTPEAEAYVRETYFDRYGEAVLYTPPSLEGDFTVPQFNGGTDWGGAAFNPETGVLFVNASNEPEALVMVEADADASHPYPYVGTGHLELYDNDGFPISKRPWGTFNAIDLNTGDIRWQVPLGTYPELEAQGLPPTGTFNIGGPLATATGLVFIGATKDARFRAFDQETGEVLWEVQLDAAGYANPSTYMVDGKQYIVIAAGGGGKPGTKAGDAFVAFALP